MTCPPPIARLERRYGHFSIESVHCHNTGRQVFNQYAAASGKSTERLFGKINSHLSNEGGLAGIYRQDVSAVSSRRRPFVEEIECFSNRPNGGRNADPLNNRYR